MRSFINWIPSSIEPRIYTFKSLNPSYISEEKNQFQAKRTFHHGTLWIIWGKKNQCLRKAPFNNFCILRFLFCVFPKSGTGKVLQIQIRWGLERRKKAMIIFFIIIRFFWYRKLAIYISEVPCCMTNHGRAVVRGDAEAPPEFGVSEKRTERELDSLLVSDRISVSVYGIGRNRKYRYWYRSRNFFYRNRIFFKKFHVFLLPRGI